MSGTAAAVDKLKSMRDAYRQKLPREIQHVRSLWNNLLYVKWNKESFTLLQRLVHNLAGTAGTYGFPEVSAVAARLDQRLQELGDGGQPPTEHDRARISGRLQNLEDIANDSRQLEVLEAGASLTPATIEPAAQRMRILILEDDVDHASILKLYLEHHGSEVHIIQNTDQLHASLEQHKPDVLLVDVMQPGSASAGIDAVNQTRAKSPIDVPVLFISARADLEARLAALRAGGTGYFVKPVDMGELAKTIDSVKDAATTRYRVLIVDDDTELAAYNAEMLDQAGLVTRKLTSPMQILSVLQEFRPDLVLMDLHLPECTGGELAQIIRQESRFAGLPIIFVSAEQNPEKQNTALAQGGDAFLVKPVADKQLVEAVINRVKRSRYLTQRLQYLDQQDPQTGLINQRALLSHLNASIDELSGAERSAVLLFIDIDKFRVLRDEVGFASSELLVTNMASIIRREIGATEHIARVGNASFVVLLPGVSPATAVSVSDRLSKVIASQIFKLGTQSFSMTVSIGVAPLTDSYNDGDSWLGGAALACDMARSDEINRCYLHEPRSDRQLEKEQDASCARLLRSSLDADALSCVYQPIASLHDDREEKYDLLVRITDQEGREVLPARFLPVAEKEGLSVEIDRWVTGHAIEVLARRHQVGKKTVFFVKLSPATLADTKFTDWLHKQLTSVSLPASALVFEFSESSVSSHIEASERLFNEIKRIGCGVALEHFGASLGSLHLLDRLPVDYIKIDGSFVNDLASNIANQGSIRQILEPANQKGTSVIASYVEDAASLRVLWECGVQYIQGNFLQTPSSEMDFLFNEQAG